MQWPLMAFNDSYVVVYCVVLSFSVIMSAAVHDIEFRRKSWRSFCRPPVGLKQDDAELLCYLLTRKIAASWPDSFISDPRDL